YSLECDGASVQVHVYRILVKARGDDVRLLIPEVVHTTLQFFTHVIHAEVNRRHLFRFHIGVSVESLVLKAQLVYTCCPESLSVKAFDVNALYRIPDESGTRYYV